MERLGIFLDSSAIIPADRARLAASEFLERILAVHGPQQVAISAIAVTEMLHGVYRDPDVSRRTKREAFFNDLIRWVPVVAYEAPIARLAARIGGEQAALGSTIPPVDLMIGATALSFNFAILTSNLRHFRKIPNLTVIPFS